MHQVLYPPPFHVSFPRGISIIIRDLNLPYPLGMHTKRHRGFISHHERDQGAQVERGRQQTDVPLETPDTPSFPRHKVVGS